MLYICPTFDYELFLGGSEYSEYEVLIEPTERLAELFSNKGCKYTLFADTCSILQYKKNGLLSFPEMAEKQLKSVIHSGNDVQLHIHPHWNKSDYVNGEWNINNKYYRLHEFPDMNEIIAENKEYLCQLLTQEDKNYRCIAFRAGGFCIQPEREILRILKDNGIMVDSSVCSGRKCKDAPHDFDYRKLRKRTAWKFDFKQGLGSYHSLATDAFIEIPVATSKTGFSKIKLFLGKMSPTIPQNKGKYINQMEPGKKNFVLDSIRLVDRFLFDPYLCEFDCADYKRMLNILKPYIKNAQKEDSVMAIIGHPKMSWSGWFYHMERFLDAITTEFSGSIITITIREAYQIIKNEK